MPCSDCISGSIHEGTPKGKIEEINGVTNYVAIPSKEYAKNKAILFLTDAFGFKFVNNQLLADGFADAGLQTYIVDYLQGDGIGPEALQPGSGFDLVAWIKKHGDAEVRPPTDKTLAGLKERGITDIAAIGYCFGGRYVFQLAQENAVKVGIAAHPSMVQFPKDTELLLAQSNVPLLLCGCETDQYFPPATQEETDKLLGGGKYKPGYKRTYASGCRHGFGVRADLSDPKQKAGKENAFRDAVDWARTYL